MNFKNKYDDIFPTLLDLSGKLDKTQQFLDAAQQKVAELQAILNTKGGFKIAINFIKVPVTLFHFDGWDNISYIQDFKALDSRKRW